MVMLITIFFTLYTTRLVLKSLGVVDYGVFGVIGGAVNGTTTHSLI